MGSTVSSSSRVLWVDRLTLLNCINAKMSRPLATAALVSAAVAAVAVVAGAVVLTRGRCRRADGQAAGAAVAAPIAPTGQYPCQYRRGRLKLFAEDATDKGSQPNYDPAALKSLDWLCVDVTPTAYARCSATLAMLPATTKLAVPSTT